MIDFAISTITQLQGVFFLLIGAHTAETLNMHFTTLSRRKEKHTTNTMLCFLAIMSLLLVTISSNERFK